ncbi:hypothetical protein THAOC_11266, partial [Thalassiosira oceanica]
MIAYKIILPSIILATTHAVAGTSNFALGNDASLETSKQPTSTLVDFVAEASTDTGVDMVVKEMSLRGFHGVDKNVLTEITEIRSKDVDDQSNRLVGASTMTHGGLDVRNGAEGDDKNSAKAGRVLLQDCSTFPSWHPQYSAGWNGGYCTFKIDCNSPGFSSALACVHYDTAWTIAGCLNTLPLPYNNINDRPSYPTQIECCNKAYAGQ